MKFVCDVCDPEEPCELKIPYCDMRKKEVEQFLNRCPLENSSGGDATGTYSRSRWVRKSKWLKMVNE